LLALWASSRKQESLAPKVELHMALDKNILQVYKDEIATKSMICSFAGCSGENKRHAIGLSPAITIQLRLV